MEIKCYIDKENRNRDRIIARAIYGLVKGEEWTKQASDIVSPPLILLPPAIHEEACLRRRRSSPAGVEMIISCSGMLFRAAESWIEKLCAAGWSGGPVPAEMPDK